MYKFPNFQLVLLTVSLTLTMASISLAQKPLEEKLTADALLARHLDSIGTTEARNSLKSMTIVGTARATFFGRGGGVADGISVLASAGNKYMIAMKFNTPEYPFESLGFDGNEFTVGFVKPGVRSNLGSFLRTNESTFTNGIPSGVLSTGWELLHFDPKAAKIKYAGTKKIGGVRYHELDFNPKKGSDLSMSLFFDPETYSHVRTEYKRIIAAQQGGSVDASARQSETRYTMVEEFGDFKKEGDLTLPHSYKISLEILSGNGTTSYEWQMQLQRFTFNQDIDAKDFRVDTYQ
ncbi:MAG TPA: hypothetical protein PLK77_09345 [Pyrinomonadaceae bacterium]|nr:hypothetical protein [Pyrinomonadaceae bacterium]